MARESASGVRVLQIGKFYPPVRGGMETHLQNLCRALTPDVELDVIVANTNRHTLHECDGSIRVHRIGTFAHIASASICPAMIAAIRRTPADIVHLHSPNPTAVLSYLASGHPGRLVVTHHSDIVRQQLLKVVYEPWLRRLMSRAEAIISFSPNYIESSPVLRRYREKCHVVSHGIDPSRFRTQRTEAVEAIKSRYGQRMVLTVGRLVYYKGFEYLIRAIAGTDATLVIIGNGPLRPQLQHLATSLGIQNRVHFLGDVDDVAPYYQAAKLFALPSTARSEAFGIVQVEAMACGTPVVNTQLASGVPFVSLNGVTGLTVPPANVDSLRNAIDLLLWNKALHRQFSESAEERVKAHFTIDEMASRTLRIYDEVLRDKVRFAETAVAAAHD